MTTGEADMVAGRLSPASQRRRPPLSSLLSPLLVPLFSRRRRFWWHYYHWLSTAVTGGTYGGRHKALCSCVIEMFICCSVSERNPYLEARGLVFYFVSCLALILFSNSFVKYYSAFIYLIRLFIDSCFSLSDYIC